MATATKARVTHVVRKIFSGSGVNYKRGQCIDPSGWRLAYKLEEQGRIQLLVETVEPVQSVDGRWWETEALARAADRAEVPGPSPDPEVAGEAEPDAEPVEDTGPAKTYPEQITRGHYLLSNGEKVKGSRATAEKLEAELHNE